MHARLITILSIVAIASGCVTQPAWDECTRASRWQGSNAGAFGVGNW